MTQRLEINRSFHHKFKNSSVGGFICFQNCVAVCIKQAISRLVYGPLAVGLPTPGANAKWSPADSAKRDQRWVRAAPELSPMLLIIAWSRASEVTAHALPGLNQPRAPLGRAIVLHAARRRATARPLHQMAGALSVLLKVWVAGETCSRRRRAGKGWMTRLLSSCGSWLRLTFPNTPNYGGTLPNLDQSQNGPLDGLGLFFIWWSICEGNIFLKHNRCQGWAARITLKV